MVFLKNEVFPERFFRVRKNISNRDDSWSRGVFQFFFLEENFSAARAPSVPSFSPRSEVPLY